MAQRYPRRPAGRPPASVIPLTPLPSDAPSSQWPTFALGPAQRAVIRASALPRGEQAPWLLTTPLTAPISAEVTLPAAPLAPAATGTLAGVSHETLVGATAPSRSIRTSGPQPGPLAAAAAGAPRAATPTARLAAAQTGAPGGGRIAPAQQAPQRPATPAPRGPGVAAAGRNIPANRAPVWSPLPTGQGLAPSMPDAVGQRLAWVALTVSALAALICWLAVLAPLLGLVPLALAVAGVVCGSLAQRRTLRRSSERRLAVAGITLGYLGAIAAVGLLIFVVTHGGG